ncbi:hypothetical protein C6H64_13495 [Photorhabdus luminescens]|uniref:hypothetical protein n=1 Tax=Photorhabdus akhurstii TaxID=171438 RepID=UPI000CF8AE8B|nr:hypothetical protein C6H64_13495 [Photorhabdus luminescens]PQQ33731.1 hypothetical protein C6H69_09455 [Photorhabdus luminescens]
MMTRHTDQAANKSKRLTVSTDAKQFSLNTLPDFDKCLQLEFLSLPISELELGAELFEYSLWSEKFRQQFSQRPLAEFLFLEG